MLTGDVALDEAAEAFAGVFVDNGHHFDGTPVGGGVELEVDRPDPIGGIGSHGVWNRRGTATIAATPLRYPQPFLAPKTLNLLVIDLPALTAGVMIGGTEPTARMRLGVGTQPLPQRRIRISRCRRGCLVSLGCSVLPGHPAGEPFTDPQDPLEVTNGRPPAFRA